MPHHGNGRRGNRGGRLLFSDSPETEEFRQDTTMGDSKAFITVPREAPPKRKPQERVRDWQEVALPMAPDTLRTQASRCMDCGIPFCHNGCPLGNMIPDWNDLVYRNRWQEAIAALHATNNFPEFTGRLCPAPCEDACVLSINDKPVTIKAIEQQIIDRAFHEGWIHPQPPARRTGKTIGIIGSGPAGLAAAQQLNRAGHWVVVYERDDRIGGLLRYGIPDFKMDKAILDRRIQQLEAEGIRFETGVDVGNNTDPQSLRSRHDALLVCIGSLYPRPLGIPGAELDGVHFAMDYLVRQNRINAGDRVGDPIDAQGKDVIIIGGGDTGADCFGTALRQGAKSVRQFQIHPEPVPADPTLNPWWPDTPPLFKAGPAHEEGGERVWGIHTTHLSGQDGRVTALHAVDVERIERGTGSGRRIVPVPGSEKILPADLVLVAIGYAHPENTLVTAFGLQTDPRGNIQVDERYATNVDGIFAAGDARRGQSLIVWAIAEGREAARGVDFYLSGHSRLPLTRTAG
jgi:glutamate synthase (NADPH/NADH) small chain